MFDPTSRYAKVGDYIVNDSMDRPVKIKKIRFLPAANAALTRQITGADRPDLMAHGYYGAADQWWRIADANYVTDPADLTIPVGKRIAIPPRS